VPSQAKHFLVANDTMLAVPQLHQWRAWRCWHAAAAVCVAPDPGAGPVMCVAGVSCSASGQQLCRQCQTNCQLPQTSTIATSPKCLVRRCVRTSDGGGGVPQSRTRPSAIRLGCRWAPPGGCPSAAAGCLRGCPPSAEQRTGFPRRSCRAGNPERRSPAARRRWCAARTLLQCSAVRRKSASGRGKGVVGKQERNLRHTLCSPHPRMSTYDCTLAWCATGKLCGRGAQHQRQRAWPSCGNMVSCASRALSCYHWCTELPQRGHWCTPLLLLRLLQAPAAAGAQTCAGKSAAEGVLCWSDEDVSDGCCCRPKLGSRSDIAELDGLHTRHHAINGRSCQTTAGHCALACPTHMLPQPVPYNPPAHRACTAHPRFGVVVLETSEACCTSAPGPPMVGPIHPTTVAGSTAGAAPHCCCQPTCTPCTIPAPAGVMTRALPR
jgi:hypothetical protein